MAGSGPKTANRTKIDPKMGPKIDQKWDRKGDPESEDLSSGIPIFGNPVLASEREARSKIYTFSMH